MFRNSIYPPFGAIALASLLVACGGDSNNSDTVAPSGVGISSSLSLINIANVDVSSAADSSTSSIWTSSVASSGASSSWASSEFGASSSSPAAPVCGWRSLATGAEYVSYDTESDAVSAGATIVLSNRGCGVIAGVLADQNLPVKIFNQVFLTGLETVPVIGEVDIYGDSLQVELTYSACQPTELDLVVSSTVRTSMPLQAHYVFTGATGNCGNLYTETFTYDLRPLQLIYIGLPSSGPREILLPNIGSYLF